MDLNLSEPDDCAPERRAAAARDARRVHDAKADVLYRLFRDGWKPGTEEDTIRDFRVTERDNHGNPVEIRWKEWGNLICHYPVVCGVANIGDSSQRFTPLIAA